MIPSASPPSIFSIVPPGLFGPLASANRQRYWQLLCRLYEEFFGPDVPMPPSDGLPRREITAAIERYLLADDPWDDEEGQGPDTPLNVRANGIYERFRTAGWLRQERVGAREKVSMTVPVAKLLALLLEFCESDPLFIGVEVRTIEMQLKEVVSGQANGDMLDGAARKARELLTSIASISVRVRDLMPELSRMESTAQFASQLFERYVGQLFLGDYAQLHTADHPLARRTAILAMLREIEHSPLHAQLLDWYREHATAGDAGRAAQRLQRSLSRLQELDRLDEYLARLDEDVRQANRRALAFLDYRLRAPARLDVLLQRACRGALRADEDALRLPVAPGALLDEQRLRAPRQKPRAIARTANALQPPTAEQLARIELLRRIKRARLVQPEDMARYVGPHLAGAARVDSQALPIASIEDFRAYQTLVTLALRSHRNGGMRRDDPLRRLLRGFRVELVPDASTRHEHLRGPRFVLHRTKDSA